MPGLDEYIPGVKEGTVTLSGINIGDLEEIQDANGNEILEFDTVASAENHVRVANAADAGRPVVSAVGDDTNVGLDIESKGSGTIRLNNVGTGVVTSPRGIVSTGATAGIGYATGAGGTVTQATSKSTGVTLNTATGQITMNGAALAAGVEVGFTVTNSAVAATDVVVVNIASGATADSYGVTVDAVASGSFRISISNLSAGSLSEAIVLNFAVIKGVSS